jgi:hypothetical protein
VTVNSAASRGGEIAFLTKGEAMKGLATMKYDMPKAAQ